MNPRQRQGLTRALSSHVAAIAADLRKQMLLEGTVRDRAKKLHADEQVGDDFDVWTDLLSRRAAVLWVLKTVYVRVLEDRGLVRPGRLLDPEAQQLFEKLAPNLGESAFLTWIFCDLASPRGGLPELFAPQPAEVGVPADMLSRALIAFWRAKDADTSFQWTFADEAFAGELMGDLYQELDPVVKDRYALCQTPEFVRDFMLERTLTPAIAELGADVVRVLDPACGSGHFLLDALRRLVAATTAQHAEWTRRTVVEHALARVVGIDLNDYACALARARLVMTAAELADATSLAEAASFHPHVYWADGLDQVEKDEQETSLQFALFEKLQGRPRATLTPSDVRAALRLVFDTKFHVVVANPPYILERDETRKQYHRELVGRHRRYVSATGKYSLSSPFTERCFQLAEKSGYVGLITSNNFMKRDFGKALVEKVLAGVDLTLVVDTSQAYIPFHGTPTVLLFGRNREPHSDIVRAVMGKRGESGTPDDPAKGEVWSSIVAGWATVGFESDYVSVADLPRETLGKHPWTLGGGGVASLRENLEAAAPRRLSEVAARIGFLTMMRQDEVYECQPRRLMSEGLVTLTSLVEGEDVRDYVIRTPPACLFPYDTASPTTPVVLPESSDAYAHFWRYRKLLRERKSTGFRTMVERGLLFYEYPFYFPETFTGLSISFADVATHNHFALARGGKLFKQTAPVIKLPAGASEDDYLALLGLLNSSTSCFWMKQVFHKKAHASQRHHPDPARAAYQFGSTGMQQFPVPDFSVHREALVAAARAIDDCARDRAGLLTREVIEEFVSASSTARELGAKIAARWLDADALRERMVALQEEIDWIVYVAFGLANPVCLIDPKRYRDLTCPRGSRPFERKSGRNSTVRVAGRALELAEGEAPPVGALPAWAEDAWRRRAEAADCSPQLQLLETPVFKRAWRDTEQNVPEPEYRRRKDAADLQEWFVERVERQAARRSNPFSLGQLVASLQDDHSVQVVAEALAGRPDFGLDSLVGEVIANEAAPQHRFHLYTEAGLAKRDAWEDVWALQRLEDAGEKVTSIPTPPEYSQGSRGKSNDFVRTEYWRLRGKLDVPKERFIAFTEVPGRGAGELLCGWTGWTPTERLKAILAMDEECEDQGIALADRVALLDSAWRLLRDVNRHDVATGARLKAELQALLGADGPSKDMLADWKKRFPPPSGRSKGNKAKPAVVEERDDEDDE